LQLLSIIALGFFLGMRHATDPDHVVAVATIVSQQKSIRRSAAIGIIWGIGHTLTIAVVGVGIIFFRVEIPTRLGLGMEWSVGVMLILLGAANMLGFLRAVPRSMLAAKQEIEPEHVHTHGGVAHSLPYEHDHTHEVPSVDWMDRTFGGLGLYQIVRPLVVGIVHGLAGSAAIALLVLATIPSASWGIVYLLIFGLGTIAGMMFITAAVAVPFAYTARRVDGLNRNLRLASGLVSLIFGLFLVYHIGFVQGLFTSHPVWTPH
jgi:high-affinity nickel-transport protein